jgi:eukaryotic-like serine/threonine-protein kinase
MDCLTAQEIERFIKDTLSEEERARAEAHLEACERCREALYDREVEELSLDGMAGQTPGRAPAVGLAPEGARIGPYILLSELGRGGQGQVYLAQDTRLRRKVALKVLPGALSSPADIQLRFRREATALSKLHHPGICTVYETGEDGSAAYIAMRYVEGKTLAEGIAEDVAQPEALASRARLERMVSIVERVARALHAAHEAGLVHRDMKPRNIMITPQGDPVILDFGLVHHQAGESLTLTQTGQVLGTPAYMSPEQVEPRGQAIDRRADVYALGVTLYEAVTLRLPFDAPTISEIYRRILTETQLDPARRNRLVTRDLKVILDVAMEKDQSRRYQTALALAEDLERLQKHRTIRARPAGPALRLKRWTRRNPVLSVSALSVFLLLSTSLAITTGLLSRVKSERDLKNTALTNLQIQKADELLADGETGEGLRYLTRILRENPSNRVAAERLMSALTFRKFAILDIPPLEHPDEVRAVDFSADGRRILTASADRTARLWDAESGSPIGEPMRHEVGIRDACFSKDGLLVATAADDSTARVWDGMTGKPITGPLRHHGPVVHAFFSPDGNLVATASDDKTAQVWEARTGVPAGKPLEHFDRVTWVEFSPDSRQLATCGRDNRTYLWTLDGSSPRRILTHGQQVNAAAFRPDGAQLVTVSVDGTAKLWDSATGELIARSEDLGSNVVHCAFSPDGARVLAATLGSQVHCLDAASLKPAFPRPVIHEGAVGRVRFSEDGLRFVSASEDGTAIVWDARDGSPLTEPLHHERWVVDARFSPDGLRVLTACLDGKARVWRVTACGAMPVMFRHQGSVVDFEFSPHGDRLVTASLDYTARVLDARTGEPLGPPMQHGDHVIKVGFSPDGQMVVTASRDHTARVWDAMKGTPLTPPLRHAADVFFAEFSPDGRLIATGDEEGVSRLWDSRSGRPVSPPLARGPVLREIHFSPDGKFLATLHLMDGITLWEVPAGRIAASDKVGKSQALCGRFSASGDLLIAGGKDNTARIFNIPSLRPQAPPLEHKGWVTTVAFSPDGRLAATGSLDHTARIWTTSTGLPLTAPLRHDDKLKKVVFSSDGRRLLTAAEDGAIRLWDTMTGLPLSEPLRRHPLLDQAAFSPSGDRIVSCGGDWFLRIWDLPRSSLPLAPAFLQLAEKMANTGVAARSDADLFARDTDREWPGWFFGDRSTRSVAPGSSQRIQDHVRKHAAEDATVSFEAALLLDPRSAEAIAGLARGLWTYVGPERPPPLVFNFLLNRLLSLAPDRPEGRWARAMLLSLAGKSGEAIRALEARGPEEDSWWWVERAQLLKEAGRHDEAASALDQAVSIAEKHPGPDGEYLRAALFDRSAVLRQLGRVPEAGADFRRARRIPPRDPEAGPEQIDLTEYYNAGLTEDWVRHIPGDRANDLASLPSGLGVYSGIEFDVRGAVQVGQGPKGALRTTWPLQVKGIRIGTKIRKFHFLHSAGWGDEDGVVVGSVALRYGDGTSQEFPLVLADNDWYFWWDLWRGPKKAPNATTAWLGRNPRVRHNTCGLWLYRSTWENPFPEKQVEGLDFKAVEGQTMPFLLGLTVEPVLAPGGADVPASARFKTWERLAGPEGGADELAAAAGQDRRLELIARSPKGGALWHRREVSPGGEWSPWESLGGALRTAPVVAQNADGSLEVFAVDNEETIRTIAQLEPDGRWGEWSSFPLRFAALTGCLSVARGGDGKLHVFAINPKSNRVFESVQRGADERSPAWTDWTQVGTYGGYRLAASACGEGRVAVILFSDRRTYWCSSQRPVPEGLAWSEFQLISPDEVAGVSLALAPQQDGLLRLFFSRGHPDEKDHRLYSRRQVAPDTWELSYTVDSPLLGARDVEGSPALVHDASGLLHAFVLCEGVVRHCVEPRFERERSWERLPPPPTECGPLNGVLAAALDVAGKLQLFALGRDGEVWRMREE